MRRSRRPLLLAVGVVAACAIAGGAAGRALTAAIPSWGTTRAGAGSQPIGSYAVSNIAYNLNATAPQSIDSVTFTLTPATAASVKIRLDGSWYSCSSGGSITCSTTSPQAQAASAWNTNLTVVAVQ